MAVTNATNARKNLFRLMEQVNENHEPVLITGKKASAVLVSESDWQAMEETLYLDAIPGMARSIRQGMNAPVGELSDHLDW
jgi:prevent-host-death family protein